MIFVDNLDRLTDLGLHPRHHLDFGVVVDGLVRRIIGAFNPLIPVPILSTQVATNFLLHVVVTFSRLADEGHLLLLTVGAGHSILPVKSPT